MGGRLSAAGPRSAGLRRRGGRTRRGAGARERSQFLVVFPFSLCYKYAQSFLAHYHLLRMSQQKKLEISERVREFRGRAKLSQDELGERLGVSGNYISMIELGKKSPGSSLRKLFESLEQSPLYRTSGDAGPGVLKETFPGHSGPVPPNPLLALLSTETLLRNFTEMAEKLAPSDPAGQKQVVGILREFLDEIERRLLASSGRLSEAQRIAMRAAKPGGSHGTK